MTHPGKELLWMATAFAGIGLGVLATAQAQDADAPLRGPQIKQDAGERARPRGDGQMRPDGERGPGGDMRPGDRFRHLLEGIDLTDEQKEQVRTILHDAAETAKAFRDEHQAELDQLRQDMRAAREAQDREKMQTLGQTLRDLMKNSPRAQAIGQIKAVLTPEQLKAFETNLGKEREQMRHREGMRRELRDKLDQMSPEEREKFMQQQREHRQQRESPKGASENRGEKLEI